METGFQIIDVHIHPFIDESQSICRYQNDIPQTSDTMYEDLKRAGISQACGSIITRVETEKDKYETPYDMQKYFNRCALGLRKKYKGFYIPGIHIDPRFVKESCEELEYMHSVGVNYVGELVPYIMDWEDYIEKDLFEILEYVQQLGMVVNYHSWFDERTENMIASFPKINFIAAHPGEGTYYASHLDFMKKYPNYNLDLSGTGLFRHGILKHGINKAGKDRFLFGSDYPICSPGLNVGGVLYEKLTTAETEAIFHENAERLLGL